MQNEFVLHGPLGNDNLRRRIGLGAELSRDGEQNRKVCLIKASGGLDDALAHALTLTCGQIDESDPSTLPATRMYRLEGIMQWGSQGAQQTARFDWNNGTVVRPVCGGVNLECEILPAFGQTDIGVNARVQVTAHAGYHSPGLKPALLTRYAVDVGGAGVIFPVPPFASRVSFYPTVTTTNAFWVNANGATVAAINTALVSGYGEGLVPNVYGLRLVPTVAGTAFFCCWQLTI